MLYTFFISMVFIAEIILFITIIRAILKADKIINDTNALLIEIMQPIREISGLGTKISAQMVDLALEFRKKIKEKQENYTLNLLNKLLITIILMKLNYKPIKRLRKSKVIKNLGKGLNLLQSMV